MREQKRSSDVHLASTLLSSQSSVRGLGDSEVWRVVKTKLRWSRVGRLKSSLGSWVVRATGENLLNRFLVPLEFYYHCSLVVIIQSEKLIFITRKVTSSCGCVSKLALDLSCVGRLLVRRIEGALETYLSQAHKSLRYTTRSCNLNSNFILTGLYRTRLLQTHFSMSLHSSLQELHSRPTTRIAITTRRLRVGWRVNLHSQIFHIAM